MASQNEQRCSYKAEVRESPSPTVDTRLAALLAAGRRTGSQQAEYYQEIR
jgi:hypothetical protein